MDILDQIDHALEDWTVGEDAMRWAPQKPQPSPVFDQFVREVQTEWFLYGEAYIEIPRARRSDVVPRLARLAEMVYGHTTVNEVFTLRHPTPSYTIRTLTPVERVDQLKLSEHRRGQQADEWVSSSAWLPPGQRDPWEWRPGVPA